MARTVVLYVLTSLLVASAWLRLEKGDLAIREVVAMIALGLLPTVAVAVGRRWSALGIGAAALLAALAQAYGIPVTDARPGGEHDFFGPVLSSFGDGFLNFYDTDLPFRPNDFPLMHSVVLVAVFAFCALAGVLLALRRPVGAAVVIAVAIGWPATLVPGGRPVAVGILGLAGILAVLFLFRAGARPVRGLVQGAAVALVLVAAAAAASTSDAVAKGAFLSWQAWDPYDQPDVPVGVRYVWNSHYLGIHFPKKKTTVFKIRVPGPQRNLFWRATTLDDYTGTGWQENLMLGPTATEAEIAATGLPQRAYDRGSWVRQDVTVEALRDIHLVGSAQPVRWQPPTDTETQTENGDIVTLPRALHRGQRYTVWSSVPQAKPSQLAKAGTDYPGSLDRYLQTIQGGGLVTPFGTPNRDTLMRVFFDATYEDDFIMQANRPLYEEAHDVVLGAPTPYAAAAALEAWFRREGGFRYDENPPAPAVQPPLVDFVTRTKRGYCQHYAGAMALMLRFLGIPARVAAGFTSGSYDNDKHEWTVTDHDAHTWVEAYFPGWGWMPFDPTPGRGLLDAQWSVGSPKFDTTDPNVFSGTSEVITSLRRDAQNSNGRPGLEGATANPAGGAGAGGVTIVRDKGPGIVALAFLVFAVAIGAVIGLKALRRAMRFTGHDPRVLASACRRDIVGYLADQGMALSPSATLAEVGGALDRYYAVDASPFVRAATLARFGPPAGAEDALTRARRELRRIRRDLRHQIGAVSRFRGAVSLRSLTM